jgi:hypothetical protein
MFERAGVQPKVAHELSQVTSILEFVARGNGVSVLAALAVPEHRPGLVFRPITPRTARRIAIACLDEKRLSPAALAFWKMARTEDDRRAARGLERHARRLHAQFADAPGRTNRRKRPSRRTRWLARSSLAAGRIQDGPWNRRTREAGQVDAHGPGDGRQLAPESLAKAAMACRREAGHVASPPTASAGPAGPRRS